MVTALLATTPHFPFEQSTEGFLMPTDIYQVTIVKYGTRYATRSDVYLNHQIYGTADEKIGMDYYFWVASNEERTIVIDTGFSRAGGEARDRDFLIDPLLAFAHLGIDPADAPPVVITHAHYDHAGNLDHFPQSAVIMSTSEFDFWASDMGGRAQFRYSTDEADLGQIARAGREGRVTTFNGTHELAPGIRILEIGGHTPGQSVVLVDTDEGTVMLASDAVHYYEEYERDMPFAFVADLPAMYRGFDLIRAMVASGEVTHLVSGHDPDTLARFSAVTGGPLAGLAATIGHRASNAKDPS